MAISTDLHADLFSLPARAVKSFETWSKLSVTIHDLDGVLHSFLEPHQFRHTQPRCLAVKASAYQQACLDLEIDRLRLELPQKRVGRVHVCHAGLVEWVVPVFNEERMDWVLFAGQRTPGARLTIANRDGCTPLRTSLWSAAGKKPDPVDDEEAGMILEGLYQLAARLQVWKMDLERVSKSRTTKRSRGHLTRQAQIRWFIYHRHHKPVTLADLAENLHLSENRAGYAVKEACGHTFIELLTQARVRSAANLLRHSDLPILNVASQSGFGDISHFHRTFKKRMGATPRQYRAQTQVAPT